MAWQPTKGVTRQVPILLRYQHLSFNIRDGTQRQADKSNDA